MAKSLKRMKLWIDYHLVSVQSRYLWLWYSNDIWIHLILKDKMLLSFRFSCSKLGQVWVQWTKNSAFKKEQGDKLSALKTKLKCSDVLMLLKANGVFRPGCIHVFFFFFFGRGCLFAAQMPGIPLPPWAWGVSWGGSWSRLVGSSGSVSKPLKAADRRMSKAVTCQVAFSSFPLVTVWRGCCSGVSAVFSHPSHFFPDPGASWFPAFVGVAVRRSEIPLVTTSHTGGGAQRASSLSQPVCPTLKAPTC